jgi:hypothetical protein
MDLKAYGRSPYLGSGVETSALKGNELEITWAPSNRWTFMANAGRQRTERSNIARDWYAWVERRLPVWQRVTDRREPSQLATTSGRSGWDNLYINDQNQVTLHQYYDLWVARYKEPIQGAEGRVSDNQREWRFNMTGRYSFTTGRLKGLALGNAVRYRSGATIGYRVKPSQYTPGSFIPDLAKPLKGPDELLFDPFVAYTLTFANKVKWHVQLNARNVFNEDDPVATYATSDGINRAYMLQYPRQIFFTNTIEF